MAKLLAAWWSTSTRNDRLNLVIAEQRDVSFTRVGLEKSRDKEKEALIGLLPISMNGSVNSKDRL